MKKLFTIIGVCFLLVCTSCKFAGNTTTPATTTSEQQLQSEINNLSIQVNAFNTAVTQLQSQINATTTTTTTTTTTEDPQVVASINSLTDTIKNLSTTISTMQKQINSNESGLLQQVEALQNSLQAAATSIGDLPITLNGLSVSYITNNITLGITGATLPGTAQFAVKITNTTANAIANLDVTGYITSSMPFAQSIAATYPQVVDATGLCTYNIYIGGTSTVYFEAYGGKTGISIPAGGTVTLRPKISLLASNGSQILATTLSVSLNAITFDIAK